MRRSLVLVTLLSTCLGVNSANSAESTETLGHAIYVAFQSTQFFTSNEITAAQQQVMASANEGDSLAKQVAPKLVTKITEQVLAQR